MSQVLEYLQTWPELSPDERAEGPRDIYVAEVIPLELQEELRAKGWNTVDIRLLTGRDAALGKLDGISKGSIRPPKTPSETRALELELRAHKLLSDKTEAPKEKKTLDGDDVDTLLSFGKAGAASAPVLLAQPAPIAPLPEKRKGRPKGSKDLKPRKPHGQVRGAAAIKMREKDEKLNGKTVVSAPAEGSNERDDNAARD